MQDSKRARELRRQLTAAERLLWAQLRNRRPGGYKFRRQYPIGPYVADFICFEARLVVEVDGETHDLTEERDARRDAWFAAQGFRVLRIRNEEVRANLSGVVATICSACETEPDASPCPSPARGEGTL
jgi:very-short-patch-repair endonuclease